MRVLVTGSNGFIATELIKNLRQSQHQVVGVYRNKIKHETPEDNHYHQVQCDLNQTDELIKLLRSCDSVIHLAADLKSQAKYENTITATKSLLTAMDKANVGKIILCSSLSVVDYASTEAQSQVDINTPICINDESLGEYAKMKRDQETLIKAWAEGAKTALIMRPGLIYTDQETSSAHVGFISRGIALISAHTGQVPLVHISRVVNHFLCACDYQIDGNFKFHHILDNPLPSQMEYVKLLQRQGSYKTGIKLHWKLFSKIAQFVRCLLYCVGLASKTPDSLRKNSVMGRASPVSFKYYDTLDSIDYT